MRFPLYIHTVDRQNRNYKKFTHAKVPANILNFSS